MGTRAWRLNTSLARKEQKGERIYPLPLFLALLLIYLPSMTRPILYSFRRCPYAMRARMAVLASGMEVELREVVLRDKPDAMLAASPKGTVPVMVLPDATALEESLDVALHALEHNDPERWLEPPVENLDAMLALITQMDGPFKHCLDRTKYAVRYVGADEAEAFSQTHRKAAMAELAALEIRLARHPFLFGEKLALADIAIAPFVRQFRNIDQQRFSADASTRLQNWLDGILESRWFTSIMRKYPQWREGDEPVRFSEAELSKEMA